MERSSSIMSDDIRRESNIRQKEKDMEEGKQVEQEKEQQRIKAQMTVAELSKPVNNLYKMHKAIYLHSWNSKKKEYIEFNCMIPSNYDIDSKLKQLESDR